MSETNTYRDENLAAFVEELDRALDRKMSAPSPVIEAVKRLHRGLSTARERMSSKA